MSFVDSLRLPVAEMQWVTQNETDLHTVCDIILNEVKFIEKKSSALLVSKSDDALKLQQVLRETRQQWEAAVKQRDSLESDIENAAREKLQCRMKQQEADSEKAAVEAKCATMMQELAAFKNNKDKLIEETKQKWARLAYATMYYKLRLECHITLDKQDEHMFTLEFFQSQQDKEMLYYIKLSHDQDGNWTLLDMHPRLAQYDRLCKYLERSQDIQRLIVYLHQKFGVLRDTLQQ